MIGFIKNAISHKLKIQLILFKLKFKPIKSLGFNVNPNGKKIFIFLAADYGNLGDVAITYAQHKFLSEKFSDYVTTEIPISRTLKGIEYVRRIIKPDDIITTVGGGNMGDLYVHIENFRQLVIQSFPNNKLIAFPQTVDFSETDSGKKKLKTAQKIYGNHQQLLLLAREEKTFNYFKTNFPKNKSMLVPDIVMTLNRELPILDRKGAIICLREDKERKLNKSEQKELTSTINKNFDSVKYRDTHIGTDFMSLKYRVSELFSIWDDFKKAEVVVTDRLHGMIFCFITKTPAIVLLNNNHKVQSSYEWIKKVNYIHLVPEYSINSVEKIIEKIKTENNKSDNLDLISEFKEVKDIVLNQL